MNKLHAVLTLRDLVAFGVGGTVGAGIFVSIGVGATQSGPALFLSFLLASVACTISGLCFCEMASRVPVSGSSYSYTFAVLGEFPAFLIGSVLVLDSIIAAAACARAWSSYVVIVLPFVPSWLSTLSIPGLEHIFSLSLLSGFVCACLGLILVFGIKETTMFNNLSTCLNILVLSVFVFAGLPLADSANWTPFAPNGLEGIVRGAGRIFFAFLGFDVVNCLAEETQGNDAKRMVPKAILLTIGIATVVYVLVAVSFVGLAPIKDIALSSPLSSAFTLRGFPALAYVVGVAAVGNTCTSILSNFLIQPRIVLRMAADGLLPSGLAHIDERGVPRYALLLSVSASTATALLIDFETLADMVSVASLLSLSTVCVCSVIARLRPPTPRTQTEDDFEEAMQPLSPLSASPASLPSLSTFNKNLIGFLILCVCTALSLLHEVPLWVSLTSLLLTALTLGTTCFQHRKVCIPPTGVFQVPFSPAMPLLGVFVNTYLLLGLPTLALVRAAAVFASAGIYYWIKLARRPPVYPPEPIKVGAQKSIVE